MIDPDQPQTLVAGEYLVLIEGNGEDGCSVVGFYRVTSAFYSVDVGKQYVEQYPEATKHMDDEHFVSWLEDQGFLVAMEGGVMNVCTWGKIKYGAFNPTPE